MEKITRKEFLELANDYKTYIEGIPYILKYDELHGTCLVPVEIQEDKDEVEKSMKNINDLKNKFTFNKDFIQVDDRFISKYKLTSYDIRELIEILFRSQNTTINSKLLEVFNDYKIKYVPEEIGYRLEV